MAEKGFKKGHKKMGGRQKGAINRNTQIANLIVEKILKNGEKGFEKIWKGLSPKEQMEFVLKTLPFEKAQMARIETTTKTQPNITVNLIAATKENVKQIDNTIDITHEEVDKE